MKARFVVSVAALAMILGPGATFASDHGWIRSVPQPVPEENVYEIEIHTINGEQPIDAEQYEVKPGAVRISASVVPIPGDTPELTIANDEIATKDFTINVEAGVLYEIGGKINPTATPEQQRDGSFWEPVVYREVKK